MRLTKYMAAVLVLGSVMFAQEGTAAKKSSKPAGTAKAASTSGAKKSKSSSTGAAKKADPFAKLRFDPNSVDKSVDPCTDFYQYACGKWMAANPIPPDQSRWGRFSELAEVNRDVLKEILEEAAAKKTGRTPIDQKVGDFYGACMNEEAVDAAGAKPLQPELDAINNIQNTEQLITEIAKLHTVGVNALFGFGAGPDLHNAAMQIAQLSDGGITLPDRDYYIKDDPKSQETRQKYVEHVTNMLKLLGEDEQKASADAKTVLDIETKLAQANMDRVARRDPKNRDHKMTAQEAEALAPNFQLAKFFVATGAPQFTELNVGNPDFFKQINGVIESTPIDEWKTYLRWHVLNSRANVLSKPFVEEAFDFNGRYMSGAKELQPRWKRCVALTDRSLGEALGQPYVKKAFPNTSKQQMLELVHEIEAAMHKDIENLDWMSAETKKQALVKLAAVTNKIGYPDKWKDYSTVKITPSNFEGNVEQAIAFEVKRNINKIGKPLDKSEWGMTPPTVNAYYNPAQNNINFPAGILQPPFFDPTIDKATNYGAIGLVIGHELTHGFDDQGSQFDADGNFKNWWTENDLAEFKKRTGCIADEYSSFVAVDDVHLNGRLTLGENTADNGGAKLAMMAYHSAASKGTAAKGKGASAEPASKADKSGFTPEQRFFLGFANVWCENRTDQSARLLAKTDPHSPGKYRVNGTVQNNADFQKAFGCKAGQPMVRENACRVW